MTTIQAGGAEQPRRTTLQHLLSIPQVGVQFNQLMIDSAVG
jgi:hypothetical protein